mgnify:FL=1
MLIANQELESLNECIFDNDQKIKKIEDFLVDFDLASIKEKRDAQKRIESILSELKNDLKIENKELSVIRRSVGKLNEVPCGDSFPTCKFIKDSHKNKKRLEGQEDKIMSLMTKITDLKESFGKLKRENYEEQIEKYNVILNKRSELISEISDKKIQIMSYKKDIQNTQPNLKDYEYEFKSLQEKYFNQEKDAAQTLIENKINELRAEIKEKDKKRTGLINKNANLKAELKMLVKQKKDYEKISKDLRVYDLFIQGTSKRGIPVQIINSMLPHINKEIAKILKGIVGFTVELEADLESNSMDLYIDYGDSKRIIELGSGMEKMMASLAIRVALINVSTLPKTNILMIDEGFGALDETNLESCGKLLQSLKKYFKNIVIISHIDEIKDIVDNTIDIMRKGVDSYVYYP